MGFVRSGLRSIKLIGYFVRFGAELLLTRPETRSDRAAWLHRFCATALHGLDLTLTVEGEFPDRGALIANHLSYLDIIVFAAIHPCVFCSKAEIRNIPVLGWMTTMAGTVYVERGRGGSALRAREGMKAAADAHLPVVFFPEGTTTNGEKLLPFHSGLLAQAIAAEEPVTAAYLHYSLDQPNAPGTTARDHMAWATTRTCGDTSSASSDCTARTLPSASPPRPSPFQVTASTANKPPSKRTRRCSTLRRARSTRSRLTNHSRAGLRSSRLPATQVQAPSPGRCIQETFTSLPHPVACRLPHSRCTHPSLRGRIDAHSQPPG